MTKTTGSQPSLFPKETKITSIAYDWTLAPLEESNFDYIISIAVAQNSKIVYSDFFWCKFPKDEQVIEFSDVSGILGLLWGFDNSKTNDNAGIFERTLADIIMVAVSKIDIEENVNELICIQGPMMPKLRGRIMYRDFAENIYFFAFTYQNEWMRRISKTITPYENGESPSSPNNNNFFPPLDIDHTSRSWFVTDKSFGNENGFHFELISNNWDITSKETSYKNDASWLLNGMDIINTCLKESSKRISEFNYLPDFFAIAKEKSDNIIKICNRQLPVLKYCKTVETSCKPEEITKTDINFKFVKNDKEIRKEFDEILSITKNDAVYYDAASTHNVSKNETVTYKEYYNKLYSFLRKTVKNNTQ